MSDAASPSRRTDLDGLRVIAILLLHAYHTGMVFCPWAFHIKNPELLPALARPMEVLHVLRMPLLMLIAGLGTALALRKRSLGGFAKERLLRLGLPLLVGMLVVVPPQIYIERLLVGSSHPLFLDAVKGAGFSGTYWDFWPTVLQGRPYPSGNLSWHHLWFVVYLLVYCLLALPLFRWLKGSRGSAWLERIAGWLARGLNVFLLFLPLALVQALLAGFPTTHALVDDPRTFSYFGLLFIFGHLLGRIPEVMERMVALRHAALGLGLGLLGVLLPDGEFPGPLEALAVQACVWLLLLSALGFARKHWIRRRPWLAYAQEIAFPFYILHQTLIVLVAFALLRVPLGPWSKLIAVFGLSFGLTWLGCEVVRRVPFLRPLFGLKPLRRAPVGAVPYPA